jgi:O-antigen ligase
VASALVFVRRGSPASRWLILGTAVLLSAAVGVLAFTPVAGGSALQTGAKTSAYSRQEIFKTTTEAARDFMPAGSGLGSFRNVYALYEDHERLDAAAVVNHAHNDYLELALETGLPGIAVLALFLAWWARTSWRVWRSPEFGPFAQAAVVASAAILVHSLVDFPLRTAAISTCFAMCLGLMTARPRHVATDRSSLWPTRHVVVS